MRRPPLPTTNAAPAMPATRNAASTIGAVKPRSPASIAPNVKPPIATTPVAKPTPSNGTALRGDGWMRAARATATIPTGMLMRKISRHDTTVSSAAQHGARRRGDGAAHRPDRDGAGSACRVGVGLADESHRRRHHHRRAGALHEAGHDQGAETGSETAGGGRGDEADDADDEGPAGAAAVTEGAGGESRAANINV